MAPRQEPSLDLIYKTILEIKGDTQEIKGIQDTHTKRLDLNEKAHTDLNNDFIKHKSFFMLVASGLGTLFGIITNYIFKQSTGN